MPGPLLHVAWPLLSLLLAQAQAPQGLGKCSEEQYLTRQMKLVKWCRDPRPECGERINCRTAMQRSQMLSHCESAKWTLASNCYGGVSEALQRELDGLLAAKAKCDRAVIEHTCTVDNQNWVDPETEPKANAPKQDGTIQQGEPAKKNESPQKGEPTNGAPPAQFNLAPPGDCTKELFRELDTKVGELCKQDKMSCKGKEDLDCDTLKLRIGRFEACIQTRRLLMDTCFRGGDQAHKDVVEQTKRGQSICLTKYQTKCGPDPRCLQ